MVFIEEGGERYLHYTSLVEALTMGPDDDRHMMVLTFSCLGVMLLKARDRFFPNLKALLITPSAFGNFDAILPEIAQPIQYLTLMMLDDLSDVPALARLAELDVKLVHLELNRCKFDHALFKTYLAPALKAQKNLCILHVELLMGTVYDFFLVLHCLPRLQELHLETEKREDVGGKYSYSVSDIRKLSPKRIKSFHGLFQLKAEMDTVVRAASESNISFDYMECAVRWACRPYQIEDLMDNIARRHSKIQKMTYCETDLLAIPAVIPHLPPMSEFRTTSSNISALFKLSSLRELVLTLFGTLVVTPEFLDQLAEGCSSLQICHLSPEKRTPPNHPGGGYWSLTLMDVVKFVLRMPRMTLLGVLFDARNPSSSSSELPALGSSNSLELLHVGSSAIDDAEYVSSAFSQYFPGLKIIGTHLHPESSLPPSTFQSEAEVELWERARRLLFKDDKGWPWRNFSRANRSDPIARTRNVQLVFG
jgi:hypothetical protein